MRPRSSRAVPALAALAAFAAPTLAAPPIPGWSSQFAASGLTFDAFQDGALCLLSHQTPDGPRLFVGGEFSAYRTPASAAPVPAAGIAVFDGLRWSGIAGSGVSTGFGDGSVRAITTLPIGGVPRIVLAGFFSSPQTEDGIAYLDDARVLHPLPNAPVPSAWFGGAYGWTPPGAPPEIIVTSGLFPQGSEYGYRFKESSTATLPPGLITVTNAFAEFDDGSGRALYIGVPMAGSGAAFKITRWNGTTLTPINPGTISWVNALGVHDDGSGPALYAAGQGAIRRLRAGTWEAAPTGGPAFGINALASFDDGTGPALYAAGQFTFTPAGSTSSTSNVARLRNGVWESVGGISGVSGITGGMVNTMAVFDEDGPGPRPPGLFIGGRFSAAGGISSIGLARWGLPICRADHDNNALLNIADLFAFLNDWFSGLSAADFNLSSTLEVQDIFDFIAAWFTAC